MIARIKEILTNIDTEIDGGVYDHEYHGDSSGVICCYFKLNDKFGLKVFTNETIENFSFEANRTAALKGYGTFIYDTITSRNCIGVLVEHVILLRLNKLYRNSIESIVDDFESKLTDMFRPTVPDWVKDIHSSNIGFRGEKLVCLDFSI